MARPLKIKGEVPEEKSREEGRKQAPDDLDLNTKHRQLESSRDLEGARPVTAGGYGGPGGSIRDTTLRRWVCIDVQRSTDLHHSGLKYLCL